jgi:hypothetical protein
MSNKKSEQPAPLHTPAREDSGAQTFRKYNYQAAYGVVLLTGAALGHCSYEYIVCEHHEDYLAKRTDGKFDAFQVKTRKRELGAWQVSSETLCSAISRFVLLESSYSSHIATYSVVSNASFLTSTSPTSGPKSIVTLKDEVSTANNESELTDHAKKALTTLTAKMPSVDKQCLWEVLKKLCFVQSIPEENFFPELSQDHVGELPWCKIQHDKLREVARELVAWVSEASSDLMPRPEVHFPQVGNADEMPHRLASRIISVEDFISRSKTIAEKTDQSFQASSTLFGGASTSHIAKTGLDATIVADLSDAQDSLINAAVALVRGGDYQEAHRRLQAIRTSTSWQNLLPAIKVRTLRLLTTIALQARNDVVGAKNLLAEASKEPGSHRLNLEHALVSIAEGNEVEAAKLLSAPATQQEHHLSGALMLHREGPSAARSYFESSSFTRSPETLRLLAICSIVAKDYQAATDQIESALEQAPDWHFVRETAGSIYFLGGIPVEWNQWSLGEWPTPPPKEFLLTTGDAKESFAKAQRIFEELSKDLNDSGNKSLRIETWHIASLAIDPACKEEASALARRLFEDYPTCTQALAWALEFSLDIALAPIARALEGRLDNSTGTLDFRDALLHIACRNQEWQQAFDLIENHRELYASASREESWLLHTTQLLTALKRNEECEALIATVENARDQLQLRCATARISAQENGWTTELAKLPFELYGLTRNPIDLAAAIEAAFFAQDYEFVVKRIGDLLSKLPTPFYLRLGLQSAQRISWHSEALQLLKIAPRVFGATSVPPDIAQLEIECLLQNGQYLDAEVSARKLTESIDDRGAWLQLFQVQLQSGDSAGAQSTARAILHRGDAEPNELVHLAGRVRGDNPELARNLLREANRLGLDEGQVAAAAAFMTFSLGLESELSTVVKKVFSNPEASEGIVEAVPLPEVVNRIQSSKAGAQNIEQAYRRGEAPLHLILERSQAPLFHIIGREFSKMPNGSVGPQYHRGLHLFSGRNRDHIQLGRLDNSRSIFVDPTSLLLLDHLSLLEIVEESHSPLQLPPSIFEWFSHELAEISGFQESRKHSLDEVIRLIGGGAIQLIDAPICEQLETPCEGIAADWVASAVEANANNWLLVEHLPLFAEGSWEPQEVPSRFANTVCSPHDLVKALQEAAHISQEICKTALETLGPVPESRTQTVDLSNYKGVLLSPGVATSLAGASILEITSGITIVHIRQGEVTGLHQESNSFAHRTESATALQRLRDRIRQKYEEGIYIIGSIAAREHEKPKTPLGSCIQELLSVQANTVDFVLADDRFLQGFDTIGEETPILSTCDLVASLDRRGIINSKEVIRVHQHLRAKGIRYVRLCDGDLYHFLLTAVSPDGSFRETAELASIRRYYSSCLNDSENLRHFAGTLEDTMKRSEMPFITHLIHASSSALVEIWSDATTPHKTKVSLSDWILTSIWIGFPAIAELSPTADQNDNHLEGMSESHLALAGLQFGESKSANEDSRAKKFYSWLFSRLGTDKRQLTSLTPYLKESIFSLSGYGKNDNERRIANLISLQVVEQMPDRVRGVLDLTEEELKTCGVSHISPVCFANFVFDCDSFWQCAELALKSGKTHKISDISEPPLSVELTASDDPNTPLYLRIHEQSGETYNLEGTDLALLRSRLDLNSAEVSRLNGVLDLDPDMLEAYLVELYSTNLTATQRINNFRKRQVVSTTDQINRLKSRLREKQSYTLEDVEPPAFEHILSYVRAISPLSPSSLDNSAEVLLDKLGLREAIERLSHLPTAPPIAVSNQVLNLTASERDDLLSALGPIECHPTRLAFVVSILAAGDESCCETAIDLLKRSKEPETFAYHQLFGAILRWSQSRILENHDPYENDPNTLFLAAWLHASRIHAVMIGIAAPLEQAKFYGQNESRCLDLALRFREDIEFSHLNSQHFSPILFLASQSLGFLHSVEITESRREALIPPLQRIMFPYKTENVPSIELLTKRSSFSSTFPNNLYKIPEGSVREFPELPDDSFLEDSQIDGRIEHLLSRIDEGEDISESWMLLNLHLQTFPLADEQRTALHDAMIQFDPKNFEGRLPAFISSMLFQFVQSRHIPGLEYNFLFQRLCVFGRGLSMLAPEISTNDRANQLVNAASLLANRSADLVANTTLLARLILGFCDDEPELSCYLLADLASLTRRLPSKAQKSLSLALIKLRESARRIESRLVEASDGDPAGESA